MNLKTRRRLLALARFMQRRAKGLRAYVKARTPRRPRTLERSTASRNAVLRDEIATRRAEDLRDEQTELRRERGEES